MRIDAAGFTVLAAFAGVLTLAAACDGDPDGDDTADSGSQDSDVDTDADADGDAGADGGGYDDCLESDCPEGCDTVPASYGVVIASGFNGSPPGPVEACDGIPGLTCVVDASGYWAIASTAEAWETLRTGYADLPQYDGDWEWTRGLIFGAHVPCNAGCYPLFDIGRHPDGSLHVDASVVGHVGDMPDPDYLMSHAGSWALLATTTEPTFCLSVVYD